jgi:hypothetical protein
MPFDSSEKTERKRSKTPDYKNRIWKNPQSFGASGPYTSEVT